MIKRLPGIILSGGSITTMRWWARVNGEFTRIMKIEFATQRYRFFPVPILSCITRRAFSEINNAPDSTRHLFSSPGAGLTAWLPNRGQDNLQCRISLF